MKGWTSEWDFNDFTIIYIFWSLFFLMIFLPITILSIYRIYYELKRRYIDVFKIVQYWTIGLAMGLNSIRTILALFFPNSLMFFKEFHKLSFINYINFQLANQLWWVIMIAHLRMFTKLDSYDESKYLKSRRKLIIKEKIARFMDYNIFIFNLAS